MSSEEYPLKEIGFGSKVFSGFAFKSKDFSEKGIPVVKIKNVNNRVVDLSGVQYFPETKVSKKHTNFFLKDNDVLIAMTGQGSVGRVARIHVNEAEKVLVNQRVGKFETDEKNLNQDYLYYVLSSPMYEQILFDTGTGSGQPNLSPKLILQTEIPLPPYDIQKEIGRILSVFDEKIYMNHQMNQTLERISEAIFNHWFVNFEFPDEQGRYYKSNGGNFVDSEVGKIPEGWEMSSLKEFVSKIVDNRGKTPPLSDGGRKLLETYQVFLDKSFPDFSKVAKQKYVSEETYANWFRAGHPKHKDLLFATVGNIPNWCLVPKNCDFCIAQNIVAIRTEKFISPYYLKFFFNTHYFLEQFNGRVIETVQPSIRIKHLMEIKVIKPPIEIMKSFDSLVKNFHDKIELNNEINDNLIQIRDSLLPKLISGKVKINILEGSAK